MSDLEKRVEALETQARRLQKTVGYYRRIGLLLGLGVVALLTIAATGRSVSKPLAREVYQRESEEAFELLKREAQDFGRRSSEAHQSRRVRGVSKQIQPVETLQLRRIEIVNPVGQVVITLDADGDNNGLINIMNADTQRVVALGAGSTGGFVGIGNASGNLGVAVSADEFGGNLGVFNSPGLPVISLRAASSTDAGFFNLFSSVGPFPGTFVDGNGAVGIFNDDTEGRLAVLLSLDRGLSGDFRLGNEDGEDVVKAYADSTGNGRIEVENSAGNATWSSDGPGSGGSTSEALPGDLDGDGDVDFSDFVIFAQNFGKRLSES